MSAVADLLKTSVIIGTLYALTGPNLAALSTLSGTDITNHRDGESDVRKQRKRRHETFLLGIRLGTGNSIGLLIVATILFIRSDSSGELALMDYWLRATLQASVGLFLIIMGIIGVIKALKNREFSMGLTDLDFGKSSADFQSRQDSSSSCSIGLESAITEIVINSNTVDGNEELSGSSGSSSSSPQEDFKRRNSIADSIVDKMVACLDDSQSLRSLDVEETLGLSEFDLRMWKAAKALTENMLYADDDYSFGSKSTEASVKTVGMDGDITSDMADGAPANPETDHKQGTFDIATKEDDIKKPVSRFTQDHTATSTQFKTKRGRPSHLCNKIFNSTNNGCFVCSPRELAILCGIIHGLSGQGEVLDLIPSVESKRVYLVIVYLGIFCVTSTLVMGGFAAFTGSVCAWLAEKANAKDEDASLSRVFLVEFGSACLSIVVGIVWLTLLAVGHLNI